MHTQWNPQNQKSLYVQTISLIKKAAADKKIEVIGLVWAQGGADAKTKEHAEAYAEHYALFIDAWRRDVDNDKLAVVCGRCGTSTNPDAYRKVKPFIDVVREAQDKLSYPHYKSVDLDDVTQGSDAVHFDSTGMIETGVRYAAAMDQLLKNIAKR